MPPFWFGRRGPKTRISTRGISFGRGSELLPGTGVLAANQTVAETSWRFLKIGNSDPSRQAVSILFEPIQKGKRKGKPPVWRGLSSQF